MRRLLLLAVLVVASGCGSGGGSGAVAGAVSTTSAGQAGPPEGCADVIAATATAGAPGTWTFTATVRSADTGWEKYADAWEVVGPDGTVYGRRRLTHPHTDEQPFTRTLSGVAVPSGVDEVTVRARDSVEGFCGETLMVRVER